MTTKDRLARRKLSLFALASELSNVSKACKIAGYSRQQFYEIRRNFQTYGAEGLLDRAALAAYCAAWARLVEAQENVETYGALVKSPTGFPMQSPWLSIAHRRAELMLRIASEFGFTPASRARIVARKDEQGELFGEAGN